MFAQFSYKTQNELIYAHKLYLNQSERSKPTFLPYLVAYCFKFRQMWALCTNLDTLMTSFRFIRDGKQETSEKEAPY